MGKMGKNNRQPKILTFEEMMGLNTPRLLAYRDRLYRVSEGPNYDDVQRPRIHKQSPEWKTAVASVKAVLANRENLDEHS